MAIGEALFGRSADYRTALDRLRAQESEIYKLQPNEDTDHLTHVRCDIARHGLTNARLDLFSATAQQSSNRNLLALVAGFGIVLGKLFGGVDYVFHLLSLL